MIGIESKVAAEHAVLNVITAAGAYLMTSYGDWSGQLIDSGLALVSELTDQLSYIADWGGQLVFPLPTLHHAMPLASNVIGMVLS